MTNNTEPKNETPENSLPVQTDTDGNNSAEDQNEDDMNFEFTIDDDEPVEQENEQEVEADRNKEAEATPDASEHEERITILEEQLDRAKDQMMRALAEAENTRKRAQKDRTDISKYAISSFARDLLDFADNFRRAMEALPKEQTEDSDDHINNILSGLEAMDRDMLSTFEKHDIKKIEPLEEMFDPNFHEVMCEIPTSDSAPGTIIEIIEPGYILHDRLLRPARVAIAKSDDGAHDDTDEPGSHVDQEA